MSETPEKPKRIADRVSAFLWASEEKPLAQECARTLAVALWKFGNDKGPLRASALAFSTVLSIVPLLSLAFAVLKGLGIQQRLEPIIIEHFAKGHQEIATNIIHSAKNPAMLASTSRSTGWPSILTGITARGANMWRTSRHA